MYKVLIDGVLFCDSRIEELAIINPIVKNAVNSAGSFTFTIPPEHPKKELIKRRKSIISVYINKEETPIFQGIITDESTDFFNQKSYVCEGELAYLNDSVQRQAHLQGLTARQLLETYINNHNSQVEESKRFEVGIVTAGDGLITCFANMNPTMQEIKEDLVDDFGGYIRVRYANNKKYIDYLADSPNTSDQIIELGKNLMDYTSNIDNTEIATSIIPLGASLDTQNVPGLDARVDIKSVNGGVDYLYIPEAVQAYGWVTKVVTWDNVNTPSILKQKAQKYLNDIQFENVVINAKAVDFGMLSDKKERFRVLDKIRVVSPVHGMDRYFVLSEQTLNLNEPEKDVITLGKEEKTSLSAQTNANNAELIKRIEQAPTSTFIESAIANATALLTGAEGGHVLINRDSDGKPFEILIMDTPDIKTATKVWRWNQNGFGYSSNGYAGPYGTAITMDGQIVADWIKAGTLSGININNGNGTFKVDALGNLIANSLTSSHAVITGGNIRISSDSQSSDIISLNFKNGNNELQTNFTPSGLSAIFSVSGNEFNTAHFTPTGINITNKQNGSFSELNYEFLTTPEVRTNSFKYNNVALPTYIDSRISGASVAYATNANHANSAGTASSAGYADYADKCSNTTSNTYNPNTFITSGDRIYRLLNGSSKRWKNSIEPVKDELLNPHRLYDIPVIQFRYNKEYSDNDSLQIGFIAEDIEEIYPIACEHDPDLGGCTNWIDRNMIPPMLALIQEQKKLIDDLTARVDALEKGVN